MATTVKKKSSDRGQSRSKACWPGQRKAWQEAIPATSNVPYHLPLVAERGEGALVWDANGGEYIDLNMAYGPLIFGHCPPGIIDAVMRQITQCGSQMGFPTQIGMRVAEKVKRLYPAMDLVRFANSGTEAMMFARLVRTDRGKQW